MSDCIKISPNGTYDGRQGFTYLEGVSRESAGSKAICMHLLTVPPGGRAKAHKHATHETTIYLMSGNMTMWWGDKLQHRMDSVAGDIVYIPADVPHLPVNTGNSAASAVIARTDPHEQESVILLPDLEHLVQA
jgi:uncharacterized RmlC-like cupin family protein